MTLLVIAACVALVLVARVRRRHRMVPQTRASDRAAVSGSLEWMAILAVILLVYALSFGPVGVMVIRLNWSTSAFRRVYEPVFWLGEHTPLKRLMGPYADFWAAYAERGRSKPSAANSNSTVQEKNKHGRGDAAQ